MTPSERLLVEAAEVGRARRAVYGPPAEDFDAVAAIVTATTGRQVTAAEAVIQMISLKLRRIGWGLADGQDADATRDSIVDLAGYAGILAEVLVPDAEDIGEDDDRGDWEARLARQHQAKKETSAEALRERLSDLGDIGEDAESENGIPEAYWPEGRPWWAGAVYYHRDGGR